MRKHLITTALIIVLMLATVPPSQAQTPVILDQLTVEVWPEFDRPTALVFYKGVVSPETVLPAELTFSLPPNVDINAVAVQSDQGLVSTTSEQTGDSITLTTENGTFHVEFYDPSLTIEGEQRSYQVVAPSDYPVNTLIWSLQQPPDASNWQSQPEGSVAVEGAFGLTHIDGGIEDVPSGTETMLAMSYTRPTTALVQTLIQNTQANTSQQTSPNNNAPSAAVPPSTTTNATTTIIGMVLGVLLLAGIVVVLMRQGTLQSITGGTKPRQPKGKADRFCTQCGKGVAKRDTFCRHCGAELA